jgi:hypothetical protein
MIQHCDVLGLDHFGKVHAIAIGPVSRRQGDFIILMDIAQPSEKRVSVSYDRDVPLLARQRGTWDMPDRPSQSFFVGAFRDHRRKTDGAYLDSPQRGAFEDGYAKTLSSRAVRFRQGWKGRRVKLFNAADSRLRTFQGSFKPPGLIGLIEPRVEPHEGAVTQRQDADGKKEVSAPTED